MNIVEYDDIREKLEEVKEICNFLPDVSTKEGYDKSKRVSLDVGKLLTILEKKRKDKKAYFLDGGRSVDDQAKPLREELEEFQLPHKGAYKELDKLKKDRETERKTKLEDRVRYMRELPESMRDSDSDGVKMAMESMQAEECLDFFENTPQALEARNTAQKELGEMYIKLLASERQAEELEALRAEKLARDKADHEENIKREAAAKAEAEKNAAIEREQLARKAQIDAEKRAIEAEKKAERDTKAAAEKARLEEVARQAEVYQIEAQALATREANKRHVGSIRGEVKVALMNMCGIDEKTAKSIVLAISRGDIPHANIEY